MIVNSVIIEKIEYDGTLKTVQLTSDYTGQLIIAFPDEYTDKRSGPFYFQNRQYDKVFRKMARANGSRRLDPRHFQRNELLTQLRIPWRNIPTERNEFSYYALSLPEYAIPLEVVISNPHTKSRMKKAVIKDKQKKCYVIYIECRSRFGVFSFDLDCTFKNARRQEFDKYQYSDDDLIEDVYAHYDAWEALASDNERDQVNIYMEGNNVEIYTVQQAAAVGRNAQANNTHMSQIKQDQQRLEPEKILESLVKLREEMMKLANSPEQVIDVAKIAEAEIAVNEGDIPKAKNILSTVGKWTYDIATKLGVALVVEQLK
ncbi:hypothetical protein [Paenibacillus oleatilyticus]|uniref:Uncharacterized protein n=1 Tax=Paenibacillus oleatilyticus TaxID=2594886 RepID=A0ABV4VBQ5_9BACL